MVFDIQDMLRLPLLSSLEEETLKALHKSGRLPVTTHRRGQLLHVEGDACDGLEIILWIVNTSSDSFYKEHVVLNSTGVL